MFAVIFEVQPKRERWDEYLDLAKQLKPELERIDGFIDNERFASRRAQGRLLSLSTWRDEKSVVRWRSHGMHHGVQEKGRFEIFADYHLRVGEITRDTQAPPGDGLRQQRFDETEVGRAKAATITEFSPAHADQPTTADLAAALGLPKDGSHGHIEHEAFESIYNPGKLLLLVSWQDEERTLRWTPTPVAGGALRHRAVRIIRDYGLSDRREAPQYFRDR
jgi:heme-degrading monooxygenase HmoA